MNTADAIREAAAELFHQHGYEATSLRQVAAAVGIQVGSLYNHISGKEMLLKWIMVGIMEDLLAAQQLALASHTETLDRLRALVDVHVRFHATRARDVFIGNSELRSLSAENRAEVIRLRDRYELTIRKSIAQAADEGKADVLDVPLQAFAVIAMGAHVSSWYRPGGGRSLDQIVDTYVAMALRQMGAKSGRRRSRTAAVR